MVLQIIPADINFYSLLNATHKISARIIRCKYFLVDPQSHDIIPFPKLFGDHFGVDRKKSGDHFGVGIISGSIWGSFRGRDHFGGCTTLLSLKPTARKCACNREAISPFVFLPRQTEYSLLLPIPWLF